MKPFEKEIDDILVSRGFNDFKWISPEDIIVSYWVIFKCLFGCSTYNKKGSCPPNVPDIEECKKFIKEYTRCILIHLEKKFDHPEERGFWSKTMCKELVKVERDVFLLGYQKAFIFFMDECRLCDECPGTKEACKNLKESRPCLEAFGVDVFETVKKFGYPISVLKDYTELTNRYSILLIE